MNRAEHIAEAERLLAAAKDVAKRAKNDEGDQKRDSLIVLELLDFVRAHTELAKVSAP